MPLVAAPLQEVSRPETPGLHASGRLWTGPRTEGAGGERQRKQDRTHCGRAKEFGAAMIRQELGSLGVWEQPKTL